MARKKQYEEKQQHGTVELPVGLHKMSYPAGTDAIFYLHWHQEFEILMVTEGEINFEIEERKYLLQEGDGVFINSNLLHSARAVDGKPCNRRRTPAQPELEAEWDDGGWQKQVLRLLRELYACPEHDTEPYELMLRSHIMGIWDRLNRQSIRVSRRDEPGETGRLEPVVKYMKDNFAYEITLSELAEMLPMSEGQFCRIFKQTMKMSPMQYLMRYRILQSCRLLQDTDKKIGEIANLSGFNNISYFNKVFLQTIGCTPREYRSTGNY